MVRDLPTRPQARSALITAPRGLVSVAVFVMTTALLPGMSSAQPVALPPLSDEAREVMDAWLLSDCAVGEGDSLELALRSFADEVRPVLMDVAQTGPPPNLLSTLDSTSNRLFDVREALLDTASARLGLTPADLAAATAVSRPDFVARERDRFEVSYRSRAILGLGVVGDSDTEVYLSGVAADSTSALFRSALFALDVLNEPD